VLEVGLMLASVRGATLTFPGGVEALAGVDLDLPAGTVTGLSTVGGRDVAVDVVLDPGWAYSRNGGVGVPSA